MCRESGPAVPDMLLPESDEIWMNVGRFEQRKKIACGVGNVSLARRVLCRRAVPVTDHISQ